MFEVGFSELLLIMALALVVLGPEKLPKVASQIGRWMGRARAMARQFRETLEEEVQLEETQRRSTPKPANRATGPAAATPEPGTASPAPAAAAGLAAGASEPLSPMDPAYPGSDPASPADDPDTRHNDYAGAAYEPPLGPEEVSASPSPADPATLTAAAGDPLPEAPAGAAPPDDPRGPQPAADTHGQR